MRLPAATSTTCWPLTKIWIVSKCILLLAAPAANAQIAADSFNPGTNSTVYAMAVQGDGKVLLGGVFTMVAGQVRNHVARVNADGTLDSTFFPNVDGEVSSLAVQADGKIVLGGWFSAIDGQTRSDLARLNADGTLDTTFNPGADGPIAALAVQADGRVVVGGWFSTVAGEAHHNVARLNGDGTADSMFNPAPDKVTSLAVQPDGKILLGGFFTSIPGQTRNYFVRLNADGTVDTAFNPGVNASVHCIVVQAEGAILLGGAFSTVAGQSRSYIARLNTDGTLDTTFAPNADGVVESIAVQADGKIFLGGWFSIVAGQTCNHIARLNADGTLDSAFTAGADAVVDCLAIQGDGRILLGGLFTTVAGQSRNYVARLSNDTAASQVLSIDSTATLITWTLSGSAPMPVFVKFQSSPDRTTWTDLGSGTFTSGRWQLASAHLPAGPIYVRALGMVPTTMGGSVSWLESVRMSDSTYLQQVFLNVLGRSPTAGELASYGSALGSGETRADVLGDLLNSAEYVGRGIEPVIRLYYAALLRYPDYPGLLGWTGALDAGLVSLTGVADGFANSQEFLQRYGSLTNAQFIQLLYRNVLGREPDPDGFAGWMAFLDSGASRGAVLLGFSESAEFQALLAPQVEVLRLYFLLYQRMPTWNELQTWLEFLKGYDQTDTLFAQGFPAGLSDSDYIDLVYHGFLRRGVDPDGLAFFSSGLSAGTMTRAQIVAALLDSPEFSTEVAPVFRLYLGAFLRLPDPAGLDGWSNALRAGLDLTSVANGFTGSPEFFAHYGNLTDAQFVQLLYHNVLGRLPDPDGFAGWTTYLASGGSRGAVLLGFTESPEAVLHYHDTIRTTLHYFTFLNAYPAQADLDFWHTYLSTLPAQLRQQLLVNLGYE